MDSSELQYVLKDETIVTARAVRDAQAALKRQRDLIRDMRYAINIRNIVSQSYVDKLIARADKLLAESEADDGER